MFIFGYFGVPAMGVIGAAVATIIGQCASFAVITLLHFRRNREVPFRPALLPPNRKIIFEMGGPAIVMQSLTAVMTYGMNLILGSASATAVTAYGVYYMQNFISMPAYGLDNASVPILPFNYGVKAAGCIRQAIRWGLGMVSVIMVTGILLLELGARPILQRFTLLQEAMELCVTAPRITTLGVLFAGANILLQGMCQALGNGIYSLIRMVIVVLPLAFFFLGCLARKPGAGWRFPLRSCRPVPLLPNWRYEFIADALNNCGIGQGRTSL